MKASFKITLTTLAAVLLVYTGCKKVTEAPGGSNNSPANTMAAGKQIAANLYKSITGRYGGVNIGDGIKAPSGVVSTPRGPRVNGIEPYCGFTIDTTLNLENQVGDTLKNVDSKYKFIYTCSSSALDGYFLSDSITYTDKGALFLNKWITGQNYIVNKSGSDFSTISMRGYIGTDFYLSTLNNSKAIIAYNRSVTQYVLNGLTINVAAGSPDIIAGTVNFNANISYLEDGNTVTGGFTGSIAFLGNHQAHITVIYNGETTVYAYNLLTNEINPI
ncbi:hypothetical protein [Mucilaginibacter sp. UR6-11]|uniref:hypothetical protein n=1 Tax=Mucilaginibacter sp. UR6-11 TaxID=1435644 RepID=UPI001E36CECC|nr:hypothetical protein [Mucilaginibacter sp. UR6-11]MCC8424530.1 hypothetical protein [Mucilaginibacter sp. UR6-11]